MKSFFSISDRDDRIPAVNPFPVLTSPQGEDSNTQKPGEGTIHHSPLNAGVTSNFKLCSKATTQKKQNNNNKKKSINQSIPAEEAKAAIFFLLFW